MYDVIFRFLDQFPNLTRSASMMEKKFLCSKEQFQRVLEFLSSDGYQIIGPTIRDKVIILDELQSVQDLPIGWTDEQEPGFYRLKKRTDQAYFGYNLGPHSPRKYLFPPQEKLFSAKQDDTHVSVRLDTDPAIVKQALIGIHPCDLQAMLIQDKVFEHSIAIYEQYCQRRANLFIMAVNCTQSVNTCFCTSMGIGPQAQGGYDVVLTEVVSPESHYFLFEVGSVMGQALCEQLQLPLAGEKECAAAKELVEQNKAQQVRHVDREHVHEMLMNSWEYKRWDDVAKRCVNCANCTLVCPTCFCSERKDAVSVDGKQADRWQMWDSCFNLSHSYVHGGCVRQSAKSRYRQWLTHKFGSWHDQFGLSGCVGCGRCITWCPVGIDVTQELDALQQEAKQTNK